MLSKPCKGMSRKTKLCTLTNIDTRNSIIQLIMTMGYFPNVGQRGCPAVETKGVFKAKNFTKPRC